MNLLHIDSSALGANSASRELTAAIVARLHAERPDLTLRYRDLDRNPLPHLTGTALTRADAQAAAAGDAVLDEFLAADILVIGAPMYNLSIPSTLKAWIDRIAVAGKTFRYGPNGPEGLAGTKRVIVASTRGGMHGNGPMDFQETYLRALFGFLGINEIEFVRAEGLAMSANNRADKLHEALQQFDALPLAA